MSLTYLVEAPEEYNTESERWQFEAARAEWEADQAEQADYRHALAEEDKDMAEEFTQDVIVPDYGTLTGEFTRNQHGYFCDEVNGWRWPYDQGIQPASASPEEAAAALLAHYEEED